MFWSKDKNKDKRNGSSKNGAKSGVGAPKSGQDANSKSQQLRAQALANAKKARQEIGEETLNQIAQIMSKKQQSIIEQTKMKVAEEDAERVVTEILLMMDEKKS